MRCELGKGIVKIGIKWPQKSDANDGDNFNYAASFKQQQFIPEQSNATIIYAPKIFTRNNTTTSLTHFQSKAGNLQTFDSRLSFIFRLNRVMKFEYEHEFVFSHFYAPMLFYIVY